MPKTKRKRKNRKSGIQSGIQSGIRSDIKTKRKAGFEPQKVARQLASMNLELATIHAPVQLRIDLINLIDNEELREKFRHFKNYRENLKANYGYNYRFIPTLSMDLIKQLNRVLDKIAYLIRLDDEQWFFQQEVRIKGIDYIADVMQSTLNDMDTLEVNMQLYIQNLRNEYSKAQLGIVNKTNRRADAIIRNPESMRTTALTRRTRSRSR
jgi:hypothetical protein